MISLRFLYRAHKYRWRNDRQELKLIRQFLRPGGIAVDIGAHKGAYLYWMQRWAGHQGQVWAFEPQPVLAAYLRRMCRVWPQVQIREEAVSSNPDGQALLVLPRGEKGTSPGASLANSSEKDGLPVKILSLDSFFQNLAPPQLIKCDCEGHELEVFRGACQLLENYHPALLFECEARHRSSSGTQPVFDYLHQLGYRGWRIDPGGVVAFDGHCPPEATTRCRAGNNFWFVKAA